MTVQRDDDRALRSYLEGRSTRHVPEGLLEATLARVEQTGQRPGWLLLDRWASPATQGRMQATGRQMAFLAIVVAIVLVAAILIVAVGSRPRLPKPFGPAGNGILAFDANGAIVVANPDGSGRHPLTLGSSIATDPSWSLDGTRIAYFEQPAPHAPGALFVAEADGSHALDVTSALRGSTPLLDQPAAWSPDGRQLAFTALTTGSADGDPHIVVVGADGNGLARIGPSSIEAWDPAWSPDGTRIAFKGQSNGVDAIYVMDALGGNARRITSVTIDTRSYGDPMAFRDPQWSPDGTRIVFFVTVQSGNQDIFVVNADGSGELDLTNSLEDEAWPIWSPDGTRIALDRQYDVVVMKPDGSDQHVLVSDPLAPEGSRPRWAPDGSRIFVFTSAVADTMEVLDVAGGPPVKIPAPGGPTGKVSWQRVAAP
jgi:Tol biopolymer transport system component